MNKEKKTEGAAHAEPVAWLRFLFFLLVARPLLALFAGFRIRHPEHLPRKGPAIILANHNSHLDTLALITICGWQRLPLLRPVAAADYFLARPWLAWFSTRVIGIIPIARKAQRDADILAPISEALRKGQIVIFYPEGSRGDAERRTRFKTGIARLAERHPESQIVPIFMHGLGKILGKGDYLPVPHYCDLVIGAPLEGDRTSKQAFMEDLEQRMQELEEEAIFPEWE